MFFNDKPVKMAELKERLSALELAKQESTKRVIMLESAKGTPYENYFQALAAISASGGVVAIVEDE
jgi:biopolymer transport protein ExbD